MFQTILLKPTCRRVKIFGDSLAVSIGGLRLIERNAMNRQPSVIMNILLSIPLLFFLSFYCLSSIFNLNRNTLWMKKRLKGSRISVVIWSYSSEVLIDHEDHTNNSSPVYCGIA